MGGVDTKNIDEHRQTYAMFLGLAKWGTIAIVGVLLLMRIFLVH